MRDEDFVGVDEPVVGVLDGEEVLAGFVVFKAHEDAFGALGVLAKDDATGRMKVEMVWIGAQCEGLGCL